MVCELHSRSSRDWSTIAIQTNKWIHGSIARRDDSAMRSSHNERNMSNEQYKSVHNWWQCKLGNCAASIQHDEHTVPDARTHIASGRADQNKCTINAKRGIIVCQMFIKGCVFQTLVKRCGVCDLALVGWGPEFTPARNNAEIE